jgi:exopolysaccharide production protein ExoZ
LQEIEWHETSDRPLYSTNFIDAEGVSLKRLVKLLKNHVPLWLDMANLRGNTNQPPRKLQGLQVLRGIAALLVVWCHLKYNLGVPAGNFSNVSSLVTDLGAIGVDIFFVISGFVIAMTATNMGNNWRTFFALRLARIVPLYFTLSTIMVIGVKFSSALKNPKEPFSFLNIFDTYAFIPLFDTGHFTGPVLANGWTLCFEMWFYICFAFCMKFAGGVRAGQLLPFFMAAGVAVLVAFFPDKGWSLPKFLFNPMTLEFCAGCILYHARNHIRTPGLCAMLFVLPILLYFANKTEFLGVHWDILNDTMLGIRRAIIWGGCAVCLVGVMTQIDLNYSWQWPKSLLLLGDASYSIYLIPVVFMAIFKLVVHGFSVAIGHPNAVIPPFGNAAVYLFGAIICGILSWKYFELPTTRLSRQILFKFVPDKRN